MQVSEARAAVGGLSQTSKMPCKSWGISAKECKTGGKLAKVEGTVCHGCYALKGAYVWPVVEKAHAQNERGQFVLCCDFHFVSLVVLVANVFDAWVPACATIFAFVVLLVRDALAAKWLASVDGACVLVVFDRRLVYVWRRHAHDQILWEASVLAHESRNHQILFCR